MNETQMNIGDTVTFKGKLATIVAFYFAGVVGIRMNDDLAMVEYWVSKDSLTK